MDSMLNNDPMGITAAIRSSFKSVFTELNCASEAWFQRTKLLVNASHPYADYVRRNVGVFPLFGSQRSGDIREVYVDLFLSGTIESEQYKPVEAIENALIDAVEDMPAKDQFDLVDALGSPLHAIAIVGHPGSGKTTLLRRLVVATAMGTLLGGVRRIPFFVSAKDLDAKADILATISELLSGFGINEADRVVTALFAGGRALLCLDGLDEALRTTADELIEYVVDLHHRYPQSIVCVTGRPYSLNSGFAGFTKVQTLPLRRSSQGEFVDKWFRGSKPEYAPVVKGKINDDRGLQELASSPLFLSLMCALYENELDFERDRDELLSRCIAGVLGRWDAVRRIVRKGPLQENFSIRDREAFVQQLAYDMLARGKIVFSCHDIEEAETVSVVSKWLRGVGISSEQFVRALCDDYGIVVERAPGVFSFSHLSIHENMAARHIVSRGLAPAIVRERFGAQGWFDVFVLVAKRLDDPNEFVKQVLQRMNMSFSYDVALMAAILANVDRLSESVRRLVARNVAGTLFRAVQLHGGELSLDGTVLKIGIPSGHRRVTRNWQDEGGRQRDDSWELAEWEDGGRFRLARPTGSSAARFHQAAIVPGGVVKLLQLISATGCSFRDIGMHQAALFSLLDAAGVREVSQVLVYTKNQRG